jgi:NAD(P)-dependent dehydrogenase (short-subunit alcohol dehydrogenase family)
MKTIVITGGTDGMGKVTAQHFLKKGERLIVIGSTASKGQRFLEEAQKMGAADRAFFIQANLSLVSENRRVINEIKSRFGSLDWLILCAGKFQNDYTETPEGLETIFATYYLSRFVLSYGLKDLLEQSPQPIIFSVAAPGAGGRLSGNIQWDDLGWKSNFKGLKVSYQGSRLNDLLAVAFNQHNSVGKIRYVLYNPGFVGTDGVTKAFNNPIGRLVINIAVKFLAKSPEQGAQPIIDHLENPPQASFSAFQGHKPVDLTLASFDKANAERLYNITETMLSKLDQPELKAAGI